MQEDLSSGEAWLKVLESPAGKKFLEFINKSDVDIQKLVDEKRDAALIAHIDGIIKKSQSIIQEFDKLDRDKRREMQSIADITAAALAGNIDQQQAWGAVEKHLKGQVSKADGQLGFHQALLLAMSKPSWEQFYNVYKTLPEGERKVVEERVEKPELGVFAKEINSRAQKLLDAGQVKTIEQGVTKVCDDAPHLFERQQRETRVGKGKRR